MCQALRDLMSDEIEKDVEEGRRAGPNDAIFDKIKKMMKNLQISAGQAMNALEIPASEQSKYIALL